MKTAGSPWGIYIGIILLVAAVSAGVYYYTSARTPSPGDIALPPVEAGEQSQKAAEQGVRIEGGEVVEKDEQGQVLWRVRAAGEITYDDKAKVLRGSDIEFEVNLQGQPTVKVQAPRFIADYAGRRIEFGDGVGGAMVDGSADFQVEKLEYQMNTQKLVGRGGAKFNRGHYSATADRIVVDMKNRQIRMHGNVLLARRQES